MALICTQIHTYGKKGKGTSKKVPGRTRKACWLLSETKHGFKLSLEVDRGKKGATSFPLKGHYFNDVVVAMDALDRLNVVVVHLKDRS